MASQKELDESYMLCAFAMSKLSRAQRKKVGAVLVSTTVGIIGEGVNGTPSGFDNGCETVINHDLVEYFDDDRNRSVYYCKTCTKNLGQDEAYLNVCSLVTKPDVLHAESNAIMKVARSHNTSVGATLYCTLSPCFECAKLIIQAGIVRVVYSEEYPYAGRTGPKPLPGLELLKKANIRVDCLPLHSQHNYV